MNEVVNNFLLAGDKFMPEMHLKQHGFSFSASGPFTKNKERVYTSYIYKIELSMTCFQHEMAFGDFKDLERRTGFDKVLRDKAFTIAKNPKSDGYERVLASMVYKLFDKKSTLLTDKSVSDSGFNIPLEFKEQKAKKLHKPIIRNFKKRRVYSGFKDNIWGADLADLQLISKFNK